MRLFLVITAICITLSPLAASADDSSTQNYEEYLASLNDSLIHFNSNAHFTVPDARKIADGNYVCKVLSESADKKKIVLESANLVTKAPPEHRDEAVTYYSSVMVSATRYICPDQSYKL